MSVTIRDSIYRLYQDFLETAEHKRDWSISNDIPWDKLDSSKATESEAQCLEIFCSEELYIPDYSAGALELVRSISGMAWFQTRWAFEESKHGMAFREYLIRSGLRSEAEFAGLEETVFARVWKLPFDTPRRMSCYGALQEGVTYTAYKLQKEHAQNLGDTVLETIFFCIARDEAAHGGFYRAIVELELSLDRAGTIGDLAHVLRGFKMPGDGLIPNYRQRLQSSGAGVSPRTFVERVVLPLMMTLGITKAELKAAQRKNAQTIECDPRDYPV